MNAFDSPLEALAVSYLSSGFLAGVNNLWALVAVVTAAVSFWRIKALSSSLVSRSEITRRRSRDAASASPSPAIMDSPAEFATGSAPATANKPLLSVTSATTSYCVSDGEGSPKVKFSVYYSEDGSRNGDDAGDDDDNGGCGGGEVVQVSEKLGFLLRDDWERSMSMKMGDDMGWYRCQDLTVLDGNVVRLWDGCGRKHAAALVADGGLAW